MASNNRPSRSCTTCPCSLRFRSNLIFFFLFLLLSSNFHARQKNPGQAKTDEIEKRVKGEGKLPRCLSVCRSAISHGQLEIRVLQWKIMAACAARVSLTLSDPQIRSNCPRCLFSSRSDAPFFSAPIIRHAFSAQTLNVLSLSDIF